LLESKFEAVYGVDIVVSQRQSRNNDTMEAKEDFPGSIGPQSTPIFIEEEGACLLRKLKRIEEDPRLLKLKISQKKPVQRQATSLAIQFERASLLLMFNMELSIFPLFFWLYYFYRLIVNIVISLYAQYRVVRKNELTVMDPVVLVSQPAMVQEWTVF
jgi:hypothetical protein